MSLTIENFLYMYIYEDKTFDILTCYCCLEKLLKEYN